MKRREKEELRCECGSLVARLVEDGLEIKCRRCKRILVIPITLTKEVTAKTTHARVTQTFGFEMSKNYEPYSADRVHETMVPEKKKHRRTK